MKFLSTIFFLLCLHVSFASAQENILSQVSGDEPIILKDNFKGFNRTMHDFNFFVDGILISPVAKIYRKVLPKPVRNSVGNFFDNLSEPYSAINNFLQGDAEQGGNNLRRFIINTSLGFGLFDVAEEMGHVSDKEDFGQTLAVWGVGDGGYIVLPILGPSTLRSAVALAPDNLLDPVNVGIKDETDGTTVLVLQYVDVVHGRSNNVDALEDLKDNSIDFYQAIKTIYWQSRLADIKR